MDVYWLEQNLADVPGDDGWLAETERLCLNRLRIPKRRADWRLGRWTAKLAVATHLKVSPEEAALREIEIVPDSSGAPSAFLRSGTGAVGISLTHRDGVAACAVSTSAVAFGCDLELIEPHGDAFLSDYFTPAEQRSIAKATYINRDMLVAALWSAKESALKALRFGLREDTRKVEIVLAEAEHLDNANFEWLPLQAAHQNGQLFGGWWQLSDRFVRTFVGILPSGPPIFLKGPAAAIAAHQRGQV